MQQKPSSISLHHRHQLQLETSSHASSSGPSRETSAAPSLLSSRRPSLSSISDHGFPTELETPTEASSRKERPTAGQAPLYMPFPSASAGQDVSNVNDTSKPSLVVLSGGSAGNSLVEAFVNLASSILFVLPVSDNGGSSSELIRVFGGPSIGDIRSRLIRLIPGTDAATEATRALLSYRLPASQSPAKVRAEWHSIVEGEHDLWRGVEPSQREILRSFLVHFEAQVLARAHRRFNFSSGSIGNFFLWACLSFFRNIESAIFLFATLTRVSENYVVCPSINTNSIVTIAAELEDGGHLIGQNSISHPESAGAGHMPIFEGTTGMLLGDDDHLGHQESAANSAEVNPNLVFDKEHIVPLPARIKSVYYINNFGLPVYPRPNSRFIAALHERDMLVFSCGSLFTSLIPCLALRGVSQAIATSHSLKAKVLLLNSLADRETPVGYTAEDYVNAISDCLNRHLQPPQLPFKASNYITHVVYVSNSQITVEESALEAMDIRTLKVPSCSRSKPLLGETQVYEALRRISEGFKSPYKSATKCS